MDIRGSTEKFVTEMNAIPTEMIRKLMANDPEDWMEITTPSIGNRVYVFDEGQSGEVVRIGKEKCKVKLDNGETKICNRNDLDIEFYACLPMWETMWSFGDTIDEWWLEDDDGLRKMSECGFRIYKSEEFGYFFGIDGAGYDFYESHWIPLYKARGLHWHDKEAV